MSAPHPLDRPVWAALTGRQSALAMVAGGARRFHPEYGVFAAVENHSAANLAALAGLVRAYDGAAIVEREPPPDIPGAVVVSQAPCVQMIAETRASGPPPSFTIVPLTVADGPEMLALATLTKPGPFFSRTHQLGQFIGMRENGRLVAMAGERMQPDGFTEVSGVCTLPDHRGRGYAAGLMRDVMGRIYERGEIPFLHAYASNTGAIGLYETLGFRVRRQLVMTSLAPS